jgi:hypothetical protein
LPDKTIISQHVGSGSQETVIRPPSEFHVDPSYASQPDASVGQVAEVFEEVFTSAILLM